jgi:TetR/AcrR family transcriptional regulator, transcriptional repressor for nem operon
MTGWSRPLGTLSAVARRAGENQTSRLTARGAATRARILRAAAELMYVRGVGATTLDDVRAASDTSKSQLYHHFADKDALVREVIALQAGQLLERQQQRLERLQSLRGLELWRDAIVQRNALRDGAYGCELGSLANELADQNEDARVALAAHFATWEALLAAGLRRMRDNGVLRPEADAERLATGIMAALQGGYLLAQTARDTSPMEIALDMALDQVRAYAVEPGTARERA